MIRLKIAPDTRWDEIPIRVGTVHHKVGGVAAGVHQDFNSTLLVRRYMCGLEPPNFLVPAIKYKVVRGGRSSPFLTIVNRSLPVRQVVCWWEGVKAYRIR